MSHTSTALSSTARRHMNEAYRCLNIAQGHCPRGGMFATSPGDPLAAANYMGLALTAMRAARDCEATRWSDYLLTRLHWAIERAEAVVDHDATLNFEVAAHMISLVCDVSALSSELREGATAGA